MQHKVCFKWSTNPWIPLQNLLRKTCPHHQSWKQPTIWRKTLTMFDDKIMDVVVTRASFAQAIGSKLRNYHTISVTTLALGSRPRQGVARWRAKRETREHVTCPRECKECEGMNPHTPMWTPMLGVGVLKGLPNLQSAIVGVKTPRFEKFFISLKRS
jgi:hypothetical protein